ncbi:hypothetical protein BTBSAS_250017 [Brochothrix thermosphacta]|uniref:Uncharacterized protein n=1 Tax=Brochothrix thermosphacta TaxID=2756 RepID=A0A2X0R3J4_BROTH|nr:hypothetical protein BTBSAS_250017 [Brochothrix thermosphacta]
MAYPPYKEEVKNDKPFFFIPIEILKTDSKARDASSQTLI